MPYFIVLIGRKCLSLVFGDVVIHELYTAAAGFYLIWLALRLLTLLSSWYPAGWNSLFQKMKTVFTVVSLLFFFLNILVDFLSAKSMVKVISFIPANTYLFKVNNRRTRKWHEICSKLTIKTPERHHWRRFFLLLTLNIFHILTHTFHI